MTKNQFRKKYREVLRSVRKDLLNLSESALASGALDLDNAEDNYVLPKAVMIAALKSANYQFAATKQMERIANNLSHFI